MDALELRQRIPLKIFDYQRLMAATSELSHPRRFVGQLIERGHIIRIKKGLYMWSQLLDPAPYSKELLANLIYGPSYVSLEYALSFYGFIPERVASVTSITCKKTKSFETPVGVYTFEHTHPDAYSEGIRLEIATNYSFLIATPEKALLDLIALRGNPESLEEDLRIERDQIQRLDINVLLNFSKAYKAQSVKAFTKGLARG